MERDMPLSSQQIAFLVFLLIPGSSLVFLTGRPAGQSAWLAELLGLLPGLFILFIVFKLHSLFPGHRITAICTKVMGRWPGMALNILFMWAVFLFLIGFVYDIAMLLRIIYPYVPRLIIYPLVILPCAYCVYLGLTVLGRMGELFFWLSLLFIILAIVLTLPLMNLSRLQPVFFGIKPLLAGALYSADWPFDEIVVLGLYLPLVTDLDQKRRVYQWYLIGAATIVLLDLTAISALGPTLADIFQFPIFETIRIAGFGEFKRLELGFLLLWFLVAITAIIVFYQSLLFVVQDLFSLRDYRALILPTGLAVIVFTACMFPSDISYQILSFKYMPVYTFATNLLYPTIIFFVALLRKKSLSKSNPRAASQ